MGEGERVEGKQIRTGYCCVETMRSHTMSHTDRSRDRVPNLRKSPCDLVAPPWPNRRGGGHGGEKKEERGERGEGRGGLTE